MKYKELDSFIAENALLKTITNDVSGVYAITIDNYIVYVGQSKNLYRRCAQHIYNIENAMCNKEKKYLLYNDEKSKKRISKFNYSYFYYTCNNILLFC